jgi:hypothetical protein
VKKIEFKTKVISNCELYVSNTARKLSAETGYPLSKALLKVSHFLELAVFEFIRCELSTDSDLVALKRRYISKSKLANSLGTFRVSKKRFCVLKTVNSINLLFFDVAVGSKVTGKTSLVQATNFFQKILDEANTNSAIVTSAMFDEFIDDLADPLKYDKVYIDANSLRHAVTQYHKAHDIKVANSLLHFHTVLGYLPHIINESPFGRKYYRGINLQGASKRIRQDALPNAIEIDINSASNEWLMQQAKLYGLDYSLIAEFSKHKKLVRIGIAIDVFGKNYSDDEFNNIKQCITAIGFGARMNNIRGNAIHDIIKNGVRRSKFTKNWFIKGYCQEMVEIGKAVYRANKDQLKDVDCLYSVTKTNRKLFKKAKLMAYLYQHFERDAMDTAFAGFQNNIKLMVHDGCYAEGLSDKDIDIIKRRFRKNSLTVSVGG